MKCASQYFDTTIAKNIDLLKHTGCDPVIEVGDYKFKLSEEDREVLKSVYIQSVH
jgi:hypothetical protein